MAKVKGPGLSMNATGSVAKTITYQRRDSQKILRKWCKPRDRKTSGQVNIRRWLSKGVEIWRGLLELQRQLWRDYRDGKERQGYYAFLHAWMIRSLAGQPQYKLPPRKGFAIFDDDVFDDCYFDGHFVDP